MSAMSNREAGEAVPAPQNPSQTLWDERIAGSPGPGGTGCAGFGRHYNRWLYRLRARQFRRFAGTLDVHWSSARVLDAGTGTGFYLDEWHKLGVRRLEALDFSVAARDLIRQRHPDMPFFRADLSDPAAPVPASRFDVISCIDVLFHIVDDAAYERAIANLARWLKPGGYLLFTENFVHHPHARTGSYHYSRTLAHIEDSLSRAGFGPLMRRPAFVLSNAPDDSRSRLLRIWWRLVAKVVRQGEWAGWLMGALLYWPERVLTAVLPAGPSTEWAVCRLTRPTTRP